MSNFQQPGIANPEDKFVPGDNNGALLLFFPTAFTPKVKTAYEETDAVTARVVRLNDGRVYENAMIFSTALVTQLKGAIPDGMVLGTLGQGENKKGNPPWLLAPHTAEHVAAAEQWLAANPRQQQPAPVAAPPAAPAWNAPAAPAAQQWGAPAAAGAAPPVAPPAPGGWQAPGAPGTAPAAWQNAGAAPTPGSFQTPAMQSPLPGGWAEPVAPPAAPAIDPNLVAYLTSKGYPPPAGTTQAAAEQMAAAIG